MIGSECLFTVRSSPVPQNYLQFIDVVLFARCVAQSVAFPRVDCGYKKTNKRSFFWRQRRAEYSVFLKYKAARKKGTN